MSAAAHNGASHRGAARTPVTGMNQTLQFSGITEEPLVGFGRQVHRPLVSRWLGRPTRTFDDWLVKHAEDGPPPPATRVSSLNSCNHAGERPPPTWLRFRQMEGRRIAASDHRYCRGQHCVPVREPRFTSACKHFQGGVVEDLACNFGRHGGPMKGRRPNGAKPPTGQCS